MKACHNPNTQTLTASHALTGSQFGKKCEREFSFQPAANNPVPNKKNPSLLCSES